MAFSGDKLLGGPQAGIIIGRRDLVSKLARHPLARAARIDKMTMAALTATLLHYLKEEHLDKVPVWRMIYDAPRDHQAEGPRVARRDWKWRRRCRNYISHRGRQPPRRHPFQPGPWQVRPPNGVTVDSLAKSLRTEPHSRHRPHRRRHPAPGPSHRSPWAGSCPDRRSDQRPWARAPRRLSDPGRDTA